MTLQSLSYLSLLTFNFFCGHFSCSEKSAFMAWNTDKYQDSRTLRLGRDTYLQSDQELVEGSLPVSNSAFWALDRQLIGLVSGRGLGALEHINNRYGIC